MAELKVKYIPIGDVKPYGKNPRKNAGAVKYVANSLREFGWRQPIVIDSEGVIVAGHTRLLAAQSLGMDTVPVVVADDLTPEQIKAYRLADNNTAEFAEWDADLLDMELDDLDIDMSLFGFELDEPDNSYNNSGRVGILAEKYIIPPVSIIDTRKGDYQEREKEWEAKIKDKGESRMEKTSLLAFGKKSFEDISILSPTLAEIIITWFSPGGNIKCFDCFAGDTAFGYVAGAYNAEFRGIELRQEQVDLNNARAEGNVLYICDDGRNVRKHISDESQDLFFSCPPYFDIEVYSDLENDASNQKTYDEFYKILDTAFREAVKCLKENRFAVVVCGDVRNKKTGEYYDFPGDIKRTFQDAGLKFYNEIILINSYGTAGIRAENTMRSRKVVKVHQNILVFYKGDTKKIKDNFPTIEVAEIGEQMDGSED